jgi:polysaccharide pyruvyl transferase WcaK-like protein
MRSNRQKIALFGMFGAGNLGNECTLEAMISNIRRYLPKAEIFCVCPGPQEVASRYGLDALPIRERPLPPTKNPALRLLRRILLGIPREFRRWLRAIGAMKHSDMLIMTGTGMLGDFGISPMGLHYDILRWTIAAKLRRCRTLFVSVGGGPLSHPLSRSFVRTSLALADYRSYRDTFSKESLENIGFKTENDSVYPDLAFSLPTAAIPHGQNSNGNHFTVGVGLMAYYGKACDPDAGGNAYRPYIAKIAAFVAWILEHNCAVRLLMGDQVYDECAMQDIRALLETREPHVDLGRLIEEPPSSVRELMSQLASTDVVVASRFHNVLLALMLQKPVVAISYDQKIDALMAGVGLDDFCQDIEHIDPGRLIEQLGNVKEKAEQVRVRLARATEAYRLALDAQYERIFNAC